LNLLGPTWPLRFDLTFAHPGFVLKKGCGLGSALGSLRAEAFSERQSLGQEVKKVFGEPMNSDFFWIVWKSTNELGATGDALTLPTRRGRIADLAAIRLEA